MTELLADLREQEERAQRAGALEADNAELFAALEDLRQPEGEELYPLDWSAVERDTRALYDLWTAAFFLPLTDPHDLTIPTTQDILNFKQRPGAAHGQMIGRAPELRARPMPAG